MFQRNVLLILGYIVAGRLGLSLSATGGGYAAPVWFPTGLAIAAVLIWGWRAIPGVWLGAFLTNLSLGLGIGTASTQLQGHSFWVAVSIATGNSLEAALARVLLTR